MYFHVNRLFLFIFFDYICHHEFEQNTSSSHFIASGEVILYVNNKTYFKTRLLIRAGFLFSFECRH